MFGGLCHFGTWGSMGSFGVWGWAGLIFNLALAVGLIGTVALLVVWAIRRSRVSAPRVR